MSTLQIESADVVKLVLQFLKENNLHKTFATLQEESNVGFNAVSSVDAFSNDIKTGKWDVVLSQVAHMKFPPDKMIDLYEQIVKEMVEAREIDTARALLRSTVPLAMMREEDGDRYTRLERLLSRPIYDESEAYPDGSNKHDRRRDIADSLKEHVLVAPPSRLVSIIGHSLKWQQHLGLLPPGTAYDVFRAAAPSKREQKEKPAKKMTSVVRFGKDAYPTAVKFTPDGQHMVCGSYDGLIELYDFETGLVDKRLDYQSRDEFMMCEDAVLSLACSPDSDFIAAGCRDGSIKVWNIRTGKAVVDFVKVHSEAVSSVMFSADGALVLSGSHDTTARIHGLKSGKTLKEFRGHTSFVNDAKFSADGDTLVTAGSDGSVKLWDVRTTECFKTMVPPQLNLVTETACNSVWFLPLHRDRMLVCNRTNSLYIMSINGDLLVTLSNDAVTSRFVSAIVSPKGKYAYGLTEENQLLCFSLSDNCLVAGAKAPETDAVTLAHHPHMNIVATTSAAGVLRIWKS